MQGSAKPQEQCQHIEATDNHHGPHHRAPRLLRGAHGEEAHQNMRQTRGAKDQRHAETDLVDRRLEIETRLKKPLPQLRRAQ